MRALIMAGGLGTRLRPLTINLPKPMVPVVNKPMVGHIVDLLKKHGIKEMTSILYFQPEIIKNYFGDGSAFGIQMDYVDAVEDFGTAGSIKNAEQNVQETFIVISGDVLTDFDLSSALKFHREKKALATMVLTRVANPLAYGVVITDKDGRIERFLEKPVWGEVFSDTVNTGIYILEPKIFEFIPAKKEFDFSRNLFPQLLEGKQPLYGYIADGYWKDIGDLAEYRNAHNDILTGKVKVMIPGNKLNTIGRDIWVGEDSEIDKQAELNGGVVIGKNCVIKADTQITNAVIGDNTQVEEGAKINNCVIWENSRIGRKAELKENIICQGVDIRAKAFIQDGAVIADECVIGEEARIKDNVKLWPHKIVEDGSTLSTSLVWGEKWSKTLFGASGISGLANIEMTPEFVAKVGAAYGAFLGKGSTVMTSRDSHKASRMINRAFICGLLSSGVNVKDLRNIPTPLLRYNLGKEGEKGAIHVRKSPYDPQVIDIKFFDIGGVDLSFTKEKSIEQLFFREDFRRAKVEDTGELSFPGRIIEDYKEGFLNAIDHKAISDARLRVVIDYAFGDGATLFPTILGELGCEVISLNANINPAKFTKTESEFNQAWKKLADITVALKADIGFMLDTGGEKLFLVDEKGQVLTDDKALALVATLVMREKKGARIGIPVTASRVIEEMAKKYQAEIIRTKTTPRSIMEQALKKEQDLLGDNLGGFIFPNFMGAFDAMFSMAKILELIAKQKVHLNQLDEELPKVHFRKERVPCAWAAKGTVMRNLVQRAKDNGEKFELIDGIKIFNKDYWVLLIPDPDKPFFNIHVESESSNKLLEVINKYKKRIQESQA